MLLFIYTFFIVFCFQINNVFISNIIFYVLVINSLIANKGFFVKKSKGNIFFFFFLLSVIISTVFFSIEVESFSSSNLISLLFSLQYIVLIFTLKIDRLKFERYFLICSYLFCIYIIFFFFYTGAFRTINTIFTSQRLWGEKYIPGWPNTTGLSLLVALFFSFKNKSNFFAKVLIFFVLILTTSRIALIGAFIIFFYFMIFRGLFEKRIQFKTVIYFLLFTSLATGLFLIISRNESLAYRLSVSYDRLNILEYCIDVIRIRPFFGYGGNTLDYIYNHVGRLNSLLNWGHTHSTILEISVRYGLVSLVFLLVFFAAKTIGIKDKDHRFIYLFLLGISLFQIYFRNFNFVFLLMYFSNCIQEKEDARNNVEYCFSICNNDADNNSFRCV